MNLSASALCLPLIVLFIATSSMPATAVEVTHEKSGFRLKVPDNFTPLEIDPAERNTLFKWIDGEPSPDNPPQVIQIQRLGGVISPTDRMKASDIPVIQGMTTTLQDFTWKGIVLDVMRQTLDLPTGKQFVSFCIQYPLSGEAIQLQVGGPIEEEPAIYALFSQVASQFDHTKPLHFTTAVGARKLSTPERVQSLISGIIRLTITAIAILFLFRLVKRAFSNKKATTTAPQQTESTKPPPLPEP